jgi:hypothetical protein
MTSCYKQHHVVVEHVVRHCRTPLPVTLPHILQHTLVPTSPHPNTPVCVYTKQATKPPTQPPPYLPRLRHDRLQQHSS